MRISSSSSSFVSCRVCASWPSLALNRSSCLKQSPFPQVVVALLVGALLFSGGTESLPLCRVLASFGLCQRKIKVSRVIVPVGSGRLSCTLSFTLLASRCFAFVVLSARMISANISSGSNPSNGPSFKSIYKAHFWCEVCFENSNELLYGMPVGVPTATFFDFLLTLFFFFFFFFFFFYFF